MESIRMRVSLRGVKPPVRRTLAFPSDIAFIDLHLIIQAAAGWGSRYTHRFDVDGKRIGPADYQVSEEADEKVSEYEGSRIVYEYGPFTADIIYLKGKTQDTDFPIILESEGLFPPEECKDLEEYFEVLKTLDDPADPAHADTVSWMKSVEDSQDTEALNKEFSEGWERIGEIAGRVPFNVAAAVGALLITGIDGYYYDSEKKRLTEETDGSAKFVPVELEDGFVDTLAGMYSDLIGLKGGNLEKLLEDEYRQGWEEYAENFLDEITDHWADAHGFIVESYADSDIAKMMDVFGEEKE